MKIELEEPFKSKWNNGYLQIHPSGRKYVVLFNTDLNRSIVSYARYLMGVKLGYEVPDHLEVDHCDDDKTNDDINNLQLLTPEQNKLKQEYNYIMNEQVRYGFECAYCVLIAIKKNLFKMEIMEQHRGIKAPVLNLFMVLLDVTLLLVVVALSVLWLRNNTEIILLAIMINHWSIIKQ